MFHADLRLLAILRKPSDIAGLAPSAWDELLRQARRHRLLGRLAAIAEASRIAHIHPVAADVLVAARRRAQAHQTRMRFEMDRLALALAELPGPRLLLKGGAYLAANLPPSRGRISSDVDVLVPLDQLNEAERRLRQAGWGPISEDEYTQRYYRRWMHELPPLRHGRRHAVVDLHHTILPRTHRFQPNAAALIAAAVPLAGSTWHMLSPPDMVLHSAAHLFADGDFADALREVVDLHDLLGVFGPQPGFWDALAERAAVHRLERPLHYALAVTQALLGHGAPAGLMRQGAAWQPLDAAMLALMVAALAPAPLEATPAWLPAVRLALYIRSHWLRMPPWMLARHLSIKAWQRLQPQGLAASRDST